MPKYVVEEAELKCSVGSGCSKLKVTSQSFSKIDSKVQATKEDCKGGENILSFGMCKITRSRCNPATIPWENCSTDFFIEGKQMLLESSTSKCRIGGTVSVNDTNQSISSEA